MLHTPRGGPHMMDDGKEDEAGIQSPVDDSSGCTADDVADGPEKKITSDSQFQKHHLSRLQKLRAHHNACEERYMKAYTKTERHQCSDGSDCTVTLDPTPDKDTDTVPELLRTDSVIFNRKMLGEYLSSSELSEEEYIPETEEESESNTSAEEESGSAKKKARNKKSQGKIMSKKSRSRPLKRRRLTRSCSLAKSGSKESSSSDKNNTGESSLSDEPESRSSSPHNSEVTEKGFVIPRQQSVAPVKPSDYLHCVNCAAYLKRKSMWRHMQRCHLSQKVKGMKPGKTRVQSLCTYTEPVPDGVNARFWKMVHEMHEDEITNMVRKEQIILKLGQHLFNKHGHDVTKHEYIRQKMRETGRLVLQGGKNSKLKEVSDFFIPANFPHVIEAVHSVAALKLGHNLKKMANVIECEAMMSGDKNALSNVQAFKQICDTKWSECVSSQALRNLSEAKWNSPQLLPFADDVKKMHQYLDSQSKKYQTKLEEEPSIKNWSELAKVTLCQAIMFNRRREGEVSKMPLNAFILRDTSSTHPDVELALSDLEKSLCKHFQRIEIRGKRGRKVPILLTPDMVTSMELLVKTRRNCDVLDENVFMFGRPQALSHFRGSDVIRQIAQSCGAKHPTALSSTKLRKHMATMSKVLNLKDNEMDDLADFLGHDIRVHRQYYRLPEGTLQLAKISEILMAMERGQLSDFKGKNLDEIQIDPQERVLMDSDGSESEDEKEATENDASPSPSPPDSADKSKKSSAGVGQHKNKEPPKGKTDKQLQPKGKDLEEPHTTKRLSQNPRRKWSPEEVEAVEKTLMDSIRSGQVPGGQTVSTTDSSTSNRESVKSEDGDEDELPYRGPFCGRALVHTDFTPSPYDTDSLKLKRGDLIDIISKPPMGTWMGLLNNKVGTFKFIYVDVLNEEEEKPKRSVKKRRKNRPPKPTSVEELLERINLKEHMPTFLFNGYEDLDTFKLLEEEDLDELNIRDTQHRAVLLTAVELLQECDSCSDPEREGSSGDSQEKLLSESSVPPADSPRDSGCYESSENLENGKSKKTTHLSRSSSGFESSHLSSPEFPIPPLCHSSRLNPQKRQDGPLPLQIDFIKSLHLRRNHSMFRGRFLSRSCDALDQPSTQTELRKLYFSVEELHLQSPERKQPDSSETVSNSTEENPGEGQENLLTPDESEVIGNGAQPSSSVSVVEYDEVPADDLPPSTQRVKPPVPPKPLPLPSLKGFDTGFGRKEVHTSTSKSNSCPEVPRISKSLIYRPAKKVHSGKTPYLETLVEEKLCSDGIDLTEEPYSDKHGRYGVPFSLVQRYSEDLDKPLGDVAVVMDQTRIRQLLKQHRIAIPLRSLSEICVIP